jgi:hypothetical protein
MNAKTTNYKGGSMERIDPVAVLADLLLDQGGDRDYLEALEGIKLNMEPENFKRLCAMMDVCPIHNCDIEICRDDQVHGYEVYDA